MSLTGWVLCGDPVRGKYHFIAEDGRSLCRKWGAFDNQPREHGNNESPDNCAACRKQVAVVTMRGPKPLPESPR